MKKFYASEWFGIEFSSFIDSSSKKIADSKFYSQFYRVFYQKYNSYDDLPDSWKDSKDEVADHLEALLSKASYENVLSIGCGVGYIECRLASKLPKDSKTRLTAVDPSVTVSQWCESEKVEYRNGFFPEALEENTSFDFAYAGALEYVFNNQQYKSFLNSIREFGINDLLLTELSVQEPIPIKHQIKDIINQIASFVGLYDPGQLWGYRRTLEEHMEVFKSCGFSIVETGKYNMGKYWIRAKVNL